ncbi:sphingosine kinase protein [Dioscorea alata]|uniref:Sphingosine kinase protein n=1 Tax=Dioscorea alata TaxID=55571 RepID=A0ACB7UPC8_DIOAL|nr:sphingosine kinase protein [Dioscorea alata]
MGYESGAEITLTELIRIDGAPTKASLDVGVGKLRWLSGEKRCLEVESEVLGFETQGTRITIKAFVGETKGPSCGKSNGKRTRRDFVLEMPTEECAVTWSEKLRNLINSFGRPRRLYILLNPYGGKKCARKIFHNEVRPLLEASDILYTLQETNYQLHAQEIARKLELLKYDGIVCVSGDGVLVEVVNGLLQRDDWDTAIKVPLGIIPAGTGNGMAKSLLDSVGDVYSISNTVFAIIRGHTRSLDVTTVLQGEARFFSVLMLTWGFVADVDIESEKYRWMGSARLDFYCFLRVMSLRKYHGHVEFVPAPGYQVYGELVKRSECCKDGIPEQICGNDGRYLQCGYEGPKISLEDLEWRSIGGPFILVWLNNVPWPCEDMMPAPEAKFSDGYLDVIIIKDCPKSAFMSILLKMKDGSHVKSPYVMYLKVKAFRLEPGQRVGNPARGGIIDSDGEVIARGEGTYECDQQDDLMAYGPPIHMTVDKGLATIYSPR